MEPARPESTPSRRAVFLDRDGVINDKAPDGSYIRSWSEFQFAPGALAALERLQAAGATPIIVTNQRGVARGVMAADDLEALHLRLRTELAAAGVRLGGIYVCPHEIGACDCRKPAVGLFLQAQRDHPWISFVESDLVGDSLSDLQAGHALGMRLWLVGEDERRADVANRAAESGIALSGSAPSLLALVESGQLPGRRGRTA